MELRGICYIAATILGLISLSKAFLRIIWWGWTMFLRPPKNLKEYGSWAVITGSTDGIGKAFAFELASKGLNLVLVGRSPTKLDNTANEIHQKQKTRQVYIKKMVIDFAKSSREDILRTVGEGTNGLDIGILINNAGVGYPYPRFLHEVDKELMESLVKVNIEGATLVTKAVLPCMLKKKKGAIVNIGSGSSAAVSSFPLYSIYAATKAYLAAFSRGISLEYRQLGIDIQCQFPLLVATKLAKIKSSSLFVPSAETYSKASLRFIGYESECTPYWSHSVQWCILQTLPEMLVNSYVFQYFLRVRRNGMLKDSVKQQS